METYTPLIIQRVLNNLILNDNDESNVNSLMELLSINEKPVSSNDKIVCALLNARVFNGELIRKSYVYKMTGMDIKEGNAIYDFLLSKLFPEARVFDNPRFYIGGFLNEIVYSNKKEIGIKADEICKKLPNLGYDPLLIAGVSVYLADHEINLKNAKPFDYFERKTWPIKKTLHSLRNKGVISPYFK